MTAHRIEATVSEGGTLALKNLPLAAGERVEVIILVGGTVAHPDADSSQFPLRGLQPYRYDDPFAEVFRTAANTDAADNPGSHLFSIDQQSNLVTGIVYEILIYASAHVEGNYVSTACVDPFEIGMSFARASTPRDLGGLLAEVEQQLNVVVGAPQTRT